MPLFPAQKKSESSEENYENYEYSEENEDFGDTTTAMEASDPYIRATDLSLKITKKKIQITFGVSAKGHEGEKLRSVMAIFNADGTPALTDDPKCHIENHQAGFKGNYFTINSNDYNTSGFYLYITGIHDVLRVMGKVDYYALLYLEDKKGERVFTSEKMEFWLSQSPEYYEQEDTTTYDGYY